MFCLSICGLELVLSFLLYQQPTKNNKSDWNRSNFNTTVRTERNYTFTSWPRTKEPVGLPYGICLNTFVPYKCAIFDLQPEKFPFKVRIYQVCASNPNPFRPVYYLLHNKLFGERLNLKRFWLQVFGLYFCVCKITPILRGCRKLRIPCVCPTWILAAHKKGLVWILSAPTNVIPCLIYKNVYRAFNQTPHPR